MVALPTALPAAHDRVRRFFGAQGARRLQRPIGAELALEDAAALGLDAHFHALVGSERRFDPPGQSPVHGGPGSKVDRLGMTGVIQFALLAEKVEAGDARQGTVRGYRADDLGKSNFPFADAEDVGVQRQKLLGVGRIVGAPCNDPAVRQTAPDKLEESAEPREGEDKSRAHRHCPRGERSHPHERIPPPVQLAIARIEGAPGKAGVLHGGCKNDRCQRPCPGKRQLAPADDGPPPPLPIVQINAQIFFQLDICGFQRKGDLRQICGAQVRVEHHRGSGFERNDDQTVYHVDSKTAVASRQPSMMAAWGSRERRGRYLEYSLRQCR